MSFINRLLQASSATLPRQCGTAAFLFGTGDFIAQAAVEKRKPFTSQYDLVRTLRLGFYGGVIFAPVTSVWFKTLERFAPGVPGSVINVASKVVADQTLAAPTMLGVFFTATTLLGGGSFKDVQKKIDDNYWSTLKASWALWIPVQTINMGFVPVQQRLLFVNVVSLAWNTFLAVVAGKGGSKSSAGGETRESAGEALPRQQDIELRGVKVH